MGSRVRASPVRMFVEFLTSRAASAVLSLATIVVVTRTATVDVAGVYIAAVAYAALLFSLLDFGTGPALVRSAVDGRTKYHVTVYIWTRAALTLVMVAIGSVGVTVLFPQEAWSAGFWSMGYVAGSMYGVVGPIGQVIGSARPFRFFTLAQGLAVLAGVSGIGLFAIEPSAAQFVAVYSGSATLVTIGALWWASREMLWISPRRLVGAVRGNLRDLALLGVATGAGNIYMRIDQAIVLRYVGSAGSAYYGLAARIVSQARLVPATAQFALSSFMAERLSAAGVGFSDDEARSLSRLGCYGGLGLALVTISVADVAVLALGGPGYEDAVTPLVVLSVGMIATCCNYLTITSAVMGSLDALYLRVTLSVLAANVAINVVVSQRYGIAACAAVGAATEFASVILLRQGMSTKQGGIDLRPLALAATVAVVAGLLKVEVAPYNAAAMTLVTGSLLLGGAFCLVRAFSEFQRITNLSSSGDSLGVAGGSKI